MAPLPIRHRRGRWAEDLAVRALEAAGLTIIERNVRVGTLELDVVAREDTTVVVVEVRGRGRTAWTRPLGSVDRRKRDRIVRAAGVLWAARWSRWRGVARVRFDVVTVDPRGRVEHVRAAFASEPNLRTHRIY